MTVGEEARLLERANRARADASVASPFELWQLAATEAAGVAGRRTVLYRHAMIHAGYLVDAETGEPFPSCPLCSEALPAA